ncbi:hypothetical protein [Egicoccus sp. AB-alg2]|uniref:hypothetical protein n=1 Tax=Egicoccus sp. AB-alg2 TaxID=3242693 RepID=UPI00359E90D9
MGRKRKLGLVLCAGAMVGMTASAASAGEITGNGKVLEVKARSICAYSGLDDDDDDGFDRTQNWGQIPKADREFLAGIGAHPGQACNARLNPYTGGGH